MVINRTVSSHTCDYLYIYVLKNVFVFNVKKITFFKKFLLSALFPTNSSTADNSTKLKHCKCFCGCLETGSAVLQLFHKV